MIRIRGTLNKLVMTLDSAMCIFNLPKHCTVWVCFTGVMVKSGFSFQGLGLP